MRKLKGLEVKDRLRTALVVSLGILLLFTLYAVEFVPTDSLFFVYTIHLALEPETAQLLLGLFAGILFSAFPKWKEVHEGKGKGGVRTWWLLSLSGGLFAVALAAVLTPYGPSFVTRMSKLTVGTADVEFASTGADRQLLLAGDRDLSDATSLLGSIELPFVKYECGLAALKSGGMEPFSNNDTTPFYSEFQDAV